MNSKGKLTTKDCFCIVGKGKNSHFHRLVDYFKRGTKNKERLPHYQPNYHLTHNQKEGEFIFTMNSLDSYRFRVANEMGKSRIAAEFSKDSSKIFVPINYSEIDPFLFVRFMHEMALKDEGLQHIAYLNAKEVAQSNGKDLIEYNEVLRMEREYIYFALSSIC